MVEGVRVRLNKGEGGKEREMVRLGDVASVVPRGRNVAVLVGEKDVSILDSLVLGFGGMGVKRVPRRGIGGLLKKMENLANR